MKTNDGLLGFFNYEVIKAHDMELILSKELKKL